ncbi:MAG: hypothetical protein E7564_00535 [Ruminococcaceae bacterium]|nr:hypothetical protein [Oscillospiraceae bacterium]
MPKLEALINEVQAVPLVISGNSMLPFLIHGRDTVYLSKVDSSLKKGDIVLYKRDDGSYILHRIYKAEENLFQLIGDAQPVIEKGIRRNQIIAKVTQIKRKGKLIKEKNLFWKFFQKIWINIIPLRAGLIKIYSSVKRIS